MPNMGISLTENQRARLEQLAEKASRSMSNMIGFLIDLEYESRTAYKERELISAGAQAPDLEPITK